MIAGLAPATQDLARRVLQRLVTPERTRDVVEVAELTELAGDPRQIRTLIDHLVAARLLAMRSGGGPTAVELVHESLIDRWPTLQRWLDQTQEDAAFLARVRGAARQWDDGARSPGLLWRGDAEHEARRWRRGYRGELGPREQAYLDAVFRLADRATRTRRIIVAGTMSLLALLVVAAAIALVSIRDAETQAVHEAQRARDEAENARAATEQLRQEKQRQVELVESLQRETARSEAATSAATTAAVQVEAGRTELERVNAKLRLAVTDAEAESKRAIEASDRARAEADRAINSEHAADEQRDRAEELARKERERADRRGKLSTTLRR